MRAIIITSRGRKFRDGSMKSRAISRSAMIPWRRFSNDNELRRGIENEEIAHRFYVVSKRQTRDVPRNEKLF